MMMFSSLDKATEHGFYWVEYRTDLGVHVVEQVQTRTDGKLMRALAFAKPNPKPAEEPEAENVGSEPMEPAA